MSTDLFSSNDFCSAATVVANFASAPHQIYQASQGTPPPGWRAFVKSAWHEPATNEPSKARRIGRSAAAPLRKL